MTRIWNERPVVSRRVVCGDAVVQAWTPRPEEPQDLTDPDDDDDLPSNSGSGGTVKPPVSAEQKQ